MRLVILRIQLHPLGSPMDTTGMPAIRTVRGVGYIACPANVEPYPDAPPDFPPNTGMLGKDPEDAYNEGYYIGVINMVDDMS